MMRKSLVVVAVSAALAVVAFAASGNAPKSTITVGDFAVKVTRAIGQPVTERSAAVQSLKTLGVEIGDADASLTEGMAAKILADLGVRVSTSSPSSAVTPGKADQLATIVGLSSSAAGVTPADGLPTDCLQLKNRGLCNDCCNLAVGCDPSTGCGRPCAKFCKAVVPPGHASPSDPNP
jgi:hypothetical protein